ncbi:MAG: hypothetical protein U9R08_01995 [Nanoarchaeota archaeon]|nr:hypothetical protein [Nanoarchaeota archaeon]
MSSEQNILELEMLVKLDSILINIQDYYRNANKIKDKQIPSKIEILENIQTYRSEVKLNGTKQENDHVPRLYGCVGDLVPNDMNETKQERDVREEVSRLYGRARRLVPNTIHETKLEKEVRDIVSRLYGRVRELVPNDQIIEAIKIKDKVINRYQGKLSARDKIVLMVNKVEPTFANEIRDFYRAQFEDLNLYKTYEPVSAVDLIYLKNLGVQTKDLQEVNKQKDLFDLSILTQLTLIRSGINLEKLLKKFSILKVKQLVNEIRISSRSDQRIKALFVGNKSVVIRKTIRTPTNRDECACGYISESIVKYCDDPEPEKQILKTIEGVCFNNVIEIPIQRWDQSTIILRYIPGDSLEEILSRNPLSFEKTIQYTKGILAGLIELQKNGIYYHRDIRPANIIIDSLIDAPVIIDLGIAIMEEDACAKDNRRYGPSGPQANDLISLGQVMYKMATGKHIFAKSQSMEKTVYAQDLADHRDWIYADRIRLNYYFKKVDKNLPINLATLIKVCLTANNDDHEKIQRLLEAYE